MYKLRKTNKSYIIKFMSKSVYERIFDPLASIADINYFNSDENWNVIE